MSGGGLKPRPALRAARLEARADEAELRRSGVLSAPERHWQRALDYAPPEEHEALDRLVEHANDKTLDSTAALEAELALMEAQERIMYRSSESLASEFRVQRDLVSRGLERVVEHARAEREGWRWGDYETPEEAIVALWRLGQRPYDLSSIVLHRETAVRTGLVEPVGDVEEASELVASISAALDGGGLDRALDIAIERKA